MGKVSVCFRCVSTKMASEICNLPISLEKKSNFRSVDAEGPLRPPQFHSVLMILFMLGEFEIASLSDYDRECQIIIWSLKRIF